MNPFPLHWRSVAVALLIAGSAAGCGPARTVEGDLAKVREQLAAGDDTAAMASLKQVVEQHPRNVDARVLMGQAMLRAGRPRPALLEFEKAVAQGASKAVLLPDYPRVLAANGLNQRIVDEFEAQPRLPDAGTQAQLWASLGEAYLALGKRDLARQRIEAAAQAKPDSPAVLLAQARLAAATGDLKAALQSVDKAVQADPRDVDARMLRAALGRPAGRPASEGLADLEAAAKAQPHHFLVRVGLIDALLQAGRLDDARKSLDVLHKEFPDAVLTHYAAAQWALQSGDNARAREIARRLLLQVAPKHPGLLHIAGVAEARLGRAAEARELLSTALKIAPWRDDTRRALAATLVTLGRGAEAQELLKSKLADDGADVHDLQIAAEAEMQVGDTRAARELLERANRSAPDDRAVQASRARLMAIAGDAAGAAKMLQGLADKDIGLQSDLALVDLHLSRREFDAAHKAIDAMQAKKPPAQMIPWLHARVEMARADIAAARGWLDRGLKDAPDDPSLLAALVALDEGEGKWASAADRVERILKTRPDAVTYAHLAQLKRRSGAPDSEVVKLLRQAIQRDPASPAYRIALIQAVRRADGAKPALITAQEGLAAMPDHPALRLMVGRLLIENGDKHQGLAELRRVTKLQPTNREAHVSLVLALEEEGDADGAWAALKSAVEAMPGDPEILRLWGAVGARRPHVEAALAYARARQRATPPSDEGWLLEVALHDAAGRKAESRDALTKGFKAAPSSLLAARLYQVLASSDPAAAAEVADRWLQANPKDNVFQRRVADVDAVQQRLPQALARLEKLLASSPDDAALLNNVAWMRWRLKRADALDASNRAVALQPSNPAFLETQSRILAAAGQKPEAARSARRVVMLSDPSDVTMRMSAASVLAEAGQKAEAAAVLDTIQTDDQAARVQIAELRKTLG